MADVKKSVDIAINIVNGVGKQLTSIVTSFDKLTDKVNKATDSVTKFNGQLAKIKAPSNIKNLGTDLDSMSKVDGKGINSLVTALSKFDKIKFPSFTAINQELAQHAKRLKDVINEYGNLNTALNAVKLSGVVGNVNSVSNATKNLSKHTKDSGTSFSQWGFALGSASTGLSKFGTQIYGVTRGFSAVSKELNASMLIFTGAFASLFALKGVITDLIEFDDAIRAAGAVSKASSVEIAQFTSAARLMGETTRYTAKDAADALKYLAQTGLSVNESIATLPNILNIAAAGNMKLGETADIVTNIMIGYGKTVKDLPQITDLMTAAFTSSSASLEEIGISLKYVGPVAHAAGLDFKETTGIIASLADAGYKGSSAGTAFRTSIARLLSPTKQMRETLSKYNIEMTDLTNQDGSMKKFTDVLDVMRTKSISAGDAMVIFGKYAGPAMISLIGKSASEIEKMNTKISESEGMALKVAHEMESGIGGALRELQSMWQEVSLAIGAVIETDVSEFIKALTKTLKDNKQQLAEVTTQIFDFIGAIAKIVGWMTSFVAGNLKVIAGLGALALAYKFVSSEAKTLLGINVLGLFTNLATNVKWSAMIGGIQGVTGALFSYSSAVKAGNAASAGTALSTLVGTLSSGSMASAGSNLASLGTSFAMLGRSVGSAISAFIIANPWLVAIAAVVGTAYAAVRILNKDYEAMAQASLDVAKASQEVNRELKYQIAELGLIKQAYATGGAEGFANAQQRLIDVLNKSNIPLDQRIDLLSKVRNGGEDASKIIEDLTKKLKAEAEANDAKALLANIAAREQQEEALKKTSKTMEFFHGKLLTGKTAFEGWESSAKKAYDNVANGWNPVGISLKGATKLYGTLFQSADELSTQFEKQDKDLKKINGSYSEFVTAQVQSGMAMETFNKIIDESPLADLEKTGAKKQFEDLSKAIADTSAAKKAADQLEIAMSEERRKQAEELLDTWKDTEKELSNLHKNSALEIQILEANGKLDHEQSSKAKLQLDVDMAKKTVDVAKQMFEQMATARAEDMKKVQASMATMSEEEKKKAQDKLKILTDEQEKALAIIEDSEAKLSAAHTAQLQLYITETKTSNDKIVEEEKKKTEAQRDHRSKLSEITKNLADKEEDLKKEKSNKLEDIEKNLTDKIKDLREKLLEKTKEFAKKRLEVEKSVSDAIKNIEISTEDKLRAIRQRGMTDKQKNRDNENAANQKLAEGRELVEEAAKNGDKESLERGKKLIEQSSDLFSGLESQKDATNGVQAAAEALKEAEAARGKQALGDIEKEKKAEIDKFNKVKDEAIKTSEEQAEKAARAFSDQMQKATREYLDQVAKENEAFGNKMKNIGEEIAKHKEKIALIGQEKELLLQNIEVSNRLSESQKQASGNYGSAVDAAKQAVEAASQFSQKIGEIKDQKIDLKITADGSTIEDRTEQVKEKIMQLEDGTYVNIKLVGEGNVPIEESIEDVKQKIEGIDITISPKADSSDIEAVIKLINEIKEIDISVTIRVDRGELEATRTLYESLVDKTVSIVLQLTGLDKWSEAKSVYDTLVSKTVTITTNYQSNGSPATENKASGGLIGAEHYAAGGNVFSRLKNRFIASGSGFKDDVPAMLMKGEFVQKVSAVKKYGKAFMAKLNAGLIPQSVAKQYETGGLVDKFANGGIVGSSMKSLLKILPKTKRKEILDMFGEKASDTSKGIKLSAENITTEIGQKSLFGMQNALSDVVSAFANGGGINQSIVDFSGQKRSIENAFAQEINTAKSSGNDEIAKILKEERDSIIKVSETLRDQLNKLKEEYNETVLNASEEYSSSKSDRDESYNRDSSDSKLDYDRETSDSELERKRNVADYDNEKINLKKEYDDGLAELAGEFSSAEYLKELTDAQESLKEIFKNINLIGTNTTGKVFAKQQSGRNYSYDQLEKLRKAYVYKPEGSQDPDFEQIQQYLMGDQYADKDTKDDYTKNVVEMNSILGGMSDLLKPLGVSSFSSNISNGIYDQLGFRNYKSFLMNNDFGKASENLSQTLSEAEKKKLKDEYDSKILELNTGFDNDTVDYKTEKERRDTDYKTEKERKDFDYNLASSEADASLKKSLDDAKKTYDENVYSANKSSKEEVDGIKATANSSIEDIKTSMADALKTAKESRDEKIAGLTSDMSSTSSTNDSSTKTVNPFNELSILDYIKRKYNIKHFNTGGFVNSTSDSVEGKDSILAKLTPKEYVMKAGVVKKFGKGFFDTLNNFRIPHFNVGGMVGSVGSKLISGGELSQNVVKHVLELTLNGSKQGELTGSPATIDKFLSDLAYARLRS